MHRIFSGLVAVLLAASVGGAQAQPSPQASQAAPKNIDEYIQLARTGVAQDKAQIIGAALELDATQNAAFWPVYKQYEAELARIGNQRYAGIKDYAGQLRRAHRCQGHRAHRQGNRTGSSASR